MSEIKGLRCVEVSEEGMKLTFRKYDQNGTVYDGQNDSFFARNSNRTAMHMTYHGDQHAKSNINPADGCPSCSRNEAMYTHASYCNGSQDNAPMEGIPWPGYIKPSAPPLEQMPQYYSPAPPSYEYMQQASYNINHPVFSAFSDENPNSCIIM